MPILMYHHKIGRHRQEGNTNGAHIMLSRPERLRYQATYNAKLRSLQTPRRNSKSEPAEADADCGVGDQTNRLIQSEASRHRNSCRALSVKSLDPNFEFYRFSLSASPISITAVYSNEWASTSSNYSHGFPAGNRLDPDRMGEMKEREAELMLKLSFLDSEMKNQNESADGWVQLFLDDIQRLISQELAKVHSTLAEDHVPFRDRQLHAHRRHIAALHQQRDLLEQGMEDHKRYLQMEAPDGYLLHCYRSGDGISNGARVYISKIC
ncbi:uncharacterized protein STEHIDRAFT_164031 [Stereum hirsutum FP-91666 SS1]|uniref:Uncharacterized protein n=1 Tax=Stereum hirsutum (strain FP-91666) TaxID=721885 RepID=R7RVK3_STEHR|nr:uncharacterized protein STEHIDRAFT_164031 [Stereum hirsutum FP-91666 SS1]EIM79074.1 hypothetical protein STEHIDRAFT_164031 [Stereum hirsutum FP-91666 SS1]